MEEKQLYFIALLPSVALTEKITTIKNSFSKDYNCRHALKIPPHITIQPPFRKGTSFEDEMQPSLQKFFSSFGPFEIKLNGFGCFDKRNNKVVFIQVEENKSLQELQQKLTHHLRSELKFSEDEIQVSFHPHITIAHRDLSQENFRRAWDEYKDKPFTDSIHISNAHLLMHNSKQWEVQAEFSFGRN